MDFNDISSRLKRVYSSAGERFDSDIKKHARFIDKSVGDKRQITLSFDGGQNETDTLNKIFLIIGNIANLKDHLKKKLANKGGDPQNIENEINNSLHLQLIIDLQNGDKHGYPLTTRRSGKDPVLEDVSHALSIKLGQTSASFIFTPFTGVIENEENSTIVITAKIKDSQGNIICYLDELINESIKKWEEVINKYQIS